MSQEAWVLVDPKGKIVDGSNSAIHDICVDCAYESGNVPTDSREILESMGYTFARVAVIEERGNGGRKATAVPSGPQPSQCEGVGMTKRYWVLRSPDGFLMTWTLAEEQEGCLREVGSTKARSFAGAEEMGYTFEQMQLIPEGCKVCSLQESTPLGRRCSPSFEWEPI